MRGRPNSRDNVSYKRIKINRFSEAGFIPRFGVTISKENLMGALNNDLVAFREFPFSKRAEGQLLQKEGYVARIVERFKIDFVVEIIKIEDSGKIWVFFDDPQLSGLQEILGSFKRNLKEGQKVLLRLHSFPPKRINGEILKILGESSSGEVEYHSLLHDLKLKHSFSNPEIQKEIEELTSKKESILQSIECYEDLTDKNFFTIDGDTAKDFDDAIYVEKVKDNFGVFVSIADVWGYLSNCPAIFEEARLRGNSIYLLNRVIPMLPTILSEELCSLRENEKKYTVCVYVEVNKEGKIIPNTFRVFPATIISKKRFTYKILNQYFLKKSSLENIGEELKNTVDQCYEVFKLMEDRMKGQGKSSLMIVHQQLDYKTNDNEDIVNVEVDRSDIPRISEKLIEIFMVLANQLIANFLDSKNIKTIYRVHKTPDPARVQNFLNIFRELNPSSEVIETSENTIQTFNDLLQKSKNNQYLQIIQYHVLQALPKAEYNLENIGHFGLNLKNYLHFTSPIRRFADLMIHKTLWMYFFDKKRYSKRERTQHEWELEKISYQVNLCEKIGVTAEKRFISRKLFRFLCSQNTKKEFKAVVFSKNPWGYLIKLENLYDGFMRIDKNIKLGANILVKPVEYSWDEFTPIN
ncbi:RNB domain-containing ribonuclease [Mycoplasma suis]|uniref:Ribonuclease R n=1 Tax=Mycoplasma suis (strain Illinois) TaxID=768700 RepID=F0QS88_MYCSL|nr:RNB domain-containing ribonuclease [Mycoplasma suis]ADX98358.1 ribonuclease R [Mycoplasma suis str. Illinois]